ncbi:Predicted NTP binding protein (contains STAS domain) [Streptomyces griseus]|nr:ABC-type transporter Mla maintaining outer membrane lipid asymmetry, MlaB component, contains STAS domain [Streptomyces griseus]SQA21151.1 Predicted NTP binding protein (contains STAS domain) [Streptomyces griseus]
MVVAKRPFRRGAARRGPMTFARRSGLPGVNTENPIALTVTGRVSRAVVADLCVELERALADPGGAAPAPGAAVDCDVGGVTRPDLTLVEAVARLALVARRSGRTLRLRRVPPELRSLLDLVGLADVVALEEGPEEPERRVPDPR